MSHTQLIKTAAFFLMAAAMIPGAIFLTHLAGAALPCIPACMLAAITCGSSSYLLTLSIRKLLPKTA